MNSVNPVVSIIIVSYNVEYFLIRCIESLMVHKCEVPFEIIVVDNNSSDNTVSSLRLEFPEILVIQSTKNIGFAAANNLGITYAKGEYFFLLNPDTVVEDNATQELFKFLSENPSAGAAGSYLKNPDGSFQMSCYPFPTLFRELWRLFHLDKLLSIALYPQITWDRSLPQKCDVIQGTSLMIKKTAWRSLGGLDENFFIYSEEVDFCYRLKTAGFERYWVPTSQVIHYGGQSTSQVAKEMFLQLYRAKTQFFKKHRGEVAGKLYKIILLMASLFRISLSPLIVWVNPQEKLQQKIIRENYKYLISSLSRL
ncbi:MAG: glycosyltransferase family 2 protein [Bellilinea sp.]